MKWMIASDIHGSVPYSDCSGAPAAPLRSMTPDVSVVYVRIHFTLCTNVYNGIFHLAFPL